MEYTFRKTSDTICIPNDNEFKDIVRNAKVYDLGSSVIASGYPMKANLPTNNRNLDEDEYDSHLIVARNLAKSKIGSGEDNFLVGIRVAFDLTLPNKVWVEAERYHFFDIVSSQSTMHKMASFNLDSSYSEYVDPRIKLVMSDLMFEYENNPTVENYLRLLYSNPAGFKLTARVTTNYRQLRTIYNQRKNHRLPEWKLFCKWIENLPFSEFIIGKVKKDAGSPVHEENT